MSKTYRVSIPIGASAFITVEASSKEEAVQLALDRGCPTICCQCSNEVEIGEFYSEEEAEAWEDE